jgi:hypothetical protein
MSWLLRGRELILGAYEYLPNLFISGSLLLGAITGVVPILILGLSTSFLGVLVLGVQQIVKNYIGGNSLLGNSKETLLSMWVSVASFVITYIFLNAYNVYILPPVAGANDELLGNRQSYMVSVMLALFVVGSLLFISRYQLGNETYVMGAGSMILGIGIGTAMWSLVSQAGRDIRMGDIFQVRNNMIQSSTVGNVTPIMCIPPT